MSFVLSFLLFRMCPLLLGEKKANETPHAAKKTHARIFLFRVTHTHTHTHKKGKKGAVFSYYAFFLFRCRHRHREEIVTHYCFHIIVVSRRAARGVSRLLTTTCVCTNAETKKKETAVATKNESSGALSFGVGRTLFTPQTVRIQKNVSTTVSSFLVF